MELNLPTKLLKGLEKEASNTRQSVSAVILKHLERAVPAYANSVSQRSLESGLEELVSFLKRLPSVRVISQSVTPDGYWWIKFDLDISHHLAWNVVQELGFVLNYISIQEPLPTVFKPVSPPPYMNGGPAEFLSWVIEPTAKGINPGVIAQFLEGRLPRPVEEECEWPED